MSHEDTLLMIEAIKSVATECHFIAFTLLLCTGLNLVSKGLLGLVNRKCTS